MICLHRRMAAPRDVDVQVSRRMQAPAAAVWQVMSDLGRLGEWLGHLDRLALAASPA